MFCAFSVPDAPVVKAEQLVFSVIYSMINTVVSCTQLIFSYIILTDHQYYFFNSPEFHQYFQWS